MFAQTFDGIAVSFVIVFVAGAKNVKRWLLKLQYSGRPGPQSRRSQNDVIDVQI